MNMFRALAIITVVTIMVATIIIIPKKQRKLRNLKDINRKLMQFLSQENSISSIHQLATNGSPKRKGPKKN